jgi:excisionase family DNA binding protein
VLTLNETENGQPRPRLTTEQVAELCQVDAKTIRRWRKEGRLPAARVGHRWLFDADSLAALLSVR